VARWPLCAATGNSPSAARGTPACLLRSRIWLARGTPASSHLARARTRRPPPTCALVARCDTDVIYGAETCVRVGACARGQRGRRDSFCPDPGRPRVCSQLLRHGSFDGRAGARLTDRRTHAIKSGARSRLLLRWLEPEAAGASRCRFVAVPRRPTAKEVHRLRRACGLVLAARRSRKRIRNRSSHSIFREGRSRRASELWELPFAEIAHPAEQPQTSGGQSAESGLHPKR
jgi:hypothetical protein